MRVLAAVAGAGLLCTTACEPTPIGEAPTSLTEYRQMDSAARRNYPAHSIVQINLTRVQNPDLPVEKRVASLELVEELGLSDRVALADLASIRRDAQTPRELKMAVLKFLFRQNYSDLISFAVEIIQDPDADPEMRQLAENWVAQNPVPELLASIVRNWAALRNPDTETERRYREMVQRITRQEWDAALLNAINSPTFDARGAALEVLRRRVERKELARRIMAEPARTDAIRALQSMLEQFAYLPSTHAEFVTTLILHKVRRDMLNDAAQLNIDWSSNYGYDFNIRDFHLLSRLSRDPIRVNLTRTQLALAIGKSLERRRHVAYAHPDDSKYKADFWLQVDKLTMADLWNIYLLDEMLSRPRVQVSLYVIARDDLGDRDFAYGGLVFYQNGQPEAIRYWPDPRAKGDDLVYHPSRQLITDGRDSLCRYIQHFEKVNNVERFGPTAAELADARENNYYGLILTRTGNETFAAAYYNPSGVVVSLGEFPLRSTRATGR